MKYKDFYNHLLLEYTENILPKVFDALKNSEDELTGVHFSRGIITGLDDFKRAIRTPHLGINKDPAHRDPLGIYVFPKKYVLSGGLKKNTGFSSQAHYYIIEPIRQKCKILNLSTMTQSDLEKILIDMEIPESYLSDKDVYHHSGNKVGHKLWGIIEKFRKDTGQNYSNYSWNKLFKKARYNVILDEGDMIIHSNEPHQMVYLEPSTYRVIDQGVKSNWLKIFSDVIKAFPEYTPKKSGKSYSDSDTRGLSLFDKNNPSVQISLSSYGNPPVINIVAHGLEDKQTKDKNFSASFDEYNHNLSSAHIISTIKNWLENSDVALDHYKSSPEHTEKEAFTEKLANYYGFKFKPNQSHTIRKVYFDTSSQMKVSMDIMIGSDIHLSINRRKSYSLSNFYYSSAVDFDDFKNEPIQALTKELFIRLRHNIDKDPYTKDYNKVDAHKFVNLLEKRVFIPRTNRPVV
jgi:hypothetical protein